MIKLLTRLRFLWVLVALMVASSCGDTPPVTSTNLVTAESQFIRTASELKTFIGASGISLSTASLQYDVELYKITYTTQLNGADIVASALVILPKTSDAVGMVSFQHGTISSYQEAPTALAASSGELILYAALASPGFIAVAPDLLGFGASKSVLHPYYVQEPTALAVADALRAAAALAQQKGLKFNSKLFLAGYSQGGYATMATHKYLEAKPLDGFTLVASFPAAGGYDVKNMQEYFFGLTSYDQPFYLAFVAQAYKVHYGWTQPLSDFFQEPYASRIPSLLDGSKTSSQINAQLTNTIQSLITADALKSIDTDSKYKYLVDAFRANSLTDWKPTIPVFMFHGDADVTVPYSNSVATYNTLIGNGASTSILTLTKLPGADHGSGVVPYIEQFVPKMLSLK